MGSETEIRPEDVRLSPRGKRGVRAARESENQRCQDAGRRAVVAAPGRAERARDKVRNNRGERGRNASDIRRRERMDPTIPRGRGGSIRNR